MINRFLDAVLRTDRGDGPVKADWARTYTDFVWSAPPEWGLLGALENLAGGLRGKSVLDLGAGPGYHSVYFARRGARVTWHDVSRVYRDIAERKAREARVRLERLSLGYLEDARRLGRFDVVYNRGCWFYCRADRPFARLLVSLLKPGGVGFVDTHNQRRSRRDGAPWYHLIYRATGVKVGHPFPPPGLVERELQRAGARILARDESEPLNDRVFFTA